MKTRGLRTPASINAILLLSIFTFVFLGVEYLYVNMMSRMVGEDQTVIAQNYALGISVLGFILYPVLNRAVHERFKALLTFSTVLVSIICIFLIQQHISYAITLTAGLILFFLMGFSSVRLTIWLSVPSMGSEHWPGWWVLPMRAVFFCNISITT